MAKKVIKILSIDGGGVRGIIPAMILAEIEKETKKPIARLFDLIAGTSTGAILTIGLTVPERGGKPKYTAAELVDLYEKHGQEIFSNSFWHKLFALGHVRDAKYGRGGMEKLSRKYFGKTRLKDALTEILIPSYEIEMSTPFLFKRREARKTKSSDYSMIQVAMAATAVPIFFKPYVVKPNNPLVTHRVFVDGAVIANNPAMSAYVEAKSIFPNADEYLLISLGTGDYTARILYELVKRWGAAQWLKPLLNVVMSGSNDLVDQQLKTLFSTKGDNLNHYYRLQLMLNEQESDFDNANPINLHTLKLASENMIMDSLGEIKKVCKRLIN